ncbi:MAG: hypothetical protein H7Y60_08600 [Rhodospirillaceae bacterium]|nr:hypothetical protein [Rhodospirillales bacterium]
MRTIMTLGAALVLVSGAAWAQAKSEARLEVAEAAPFGKHLTDADGRALYLFTADKKGGNASACADQCAQAWPPVTTQGQPQLASGLAKDKVGMIQRQDGASQLTYDGHPLYYFAQDLRSGQTAGQDKKGFGGEWYLVAPDGTPIRSEQRAQTPENR